MRSFGIVLVIALILTPLIWIMPLAQKHDITALFSQYLGIVALIAMALTQVIATRVPGIEPIFGGLDRGYVLHKWLGITAMVSILLHDTIDAEMDGLGRETGLSDLAETLGEISLYGLLILVIITITTFIPYHLWKWTHKLMGTFFAFSFFHYFFILKPFANLDPLGAYTLVFCIVGLLSYCYTLLPENKFRLCHRYEVEKIEATGDAFAVSLKPEGRGISHLAGQFVFVDFKTEESRETHPFTISQAPNQNRSLRLTIKPLGSHTSRLTKNIKPSTKVKVQGAFGHFRKPNTKGTEIWIAGGIGITPFIAWAQDRFHGTQISDENPVHLFYAVKSREQAAHLHELEAIAAATPQFHLHLYESAKNHRLSAQEIVHTTDAEVEETSVAFCGPSGLRESLRKDFIRLGLPKKRFAFEEFEIRSGIGLWAFVSWAARHYVDHKSKT